MLAALLEASLAALYLQHGFEPIRDAVVAAFDGRITYALTTHVDHKTELQEELARQGRQVVYNVLDVQGPPHDRTFRCAAVIDGEEVGRRHRPLEEGRRAGRCQAGARPSRRAA